MIAFEVAHQIREQLASQIDVEGIGPDRIAIHMPLIYDDGDNCSVYAVRRDDGKWIITDDGDAMRRAADAGIDLRKAGYAERLESLIEFYGVEQNAGALGLSVQGEEFSEAVFTLTQTCLEATWLSKMQRMARRQSRAIKFTHKLDRIIDKAIEAEHVERNWHDPEHDPRALYPVDYRITGRNRQLFLFGVATDLACTQATISCLHHQAARDAAPFDSLVIFDDEEAISKVNADRLKDVADRTFPRIIEVKQISSYLSALAI
jgi:hypothetical protein